MPDFVLMTAGMDLPGIGLPEIGSPGTGLPKSGLQPGQVVFSKYGRDKGRAFVVLSTDGDYIYITDGSMRPLQKPKKKKARHVQPTNTLFDLAAVAGPRELLDADIRKLLVPFTTGHARTHTERVEPADRIESES